MRIWQRYKVRLSKNNIQSKVIDLKQRFIDVA